MKEKVYKSPSLTVDAIIHMPNGIVLIKRKNPPHGWAMSGGFCNYGESLEDAVIREVFEETGLVFENFHQFRAFSEPNRDPRQHVVTVVFYGTAEGYPKAADDAKEVRIFALDALPSPLCFDHEDIIRQYQARIL